MKSSKPPSKKTSPKKPTKADKREEFPDARVGFQFAAREVLRENAPKGAYGPGMKRAAQLYDNLERFSKKNPDRFKTKKKNGK
jgi:hypothetical protein